MDRGNPRVVLLIVFIGVAQRFKAGSPYKHTLIATLTKGMAGPATFRATRRGYQTFEVLGSRLKPGCAQSAIVNGLLDLIGNIADSGQ